MNLLRTPLSRLLDLELKTISQVPIALNEVARMTGEAQSHRSMTGATLLFSATMKHNSRSLRGLWRLALAVGLLAVPAVLLGLLMWLTHRMIGWFSNQPELLEEGGAEFDLQGSLLVILALVTVWLALGGR